MLRSEPFAVIGAHQSDKSGAARSQFARRHAPFGHGSAEYDSSRALSQVGERTPWRLTITTYFSCGAAARGDTANSAEGRCGEAVTSHD